MRPGFLAAEQVAFMAATGDPIHHCVKMYLSFLKVMRFILQVRSCSLDTWLAEQVAFMAATGNAAAADFWEARLPPGRRPKQTDSMGLEVGLVVYAAALA